MKFVNLSFALFVMPIFAWVAVLGIAAYFFVWPYVVASFHWVTQCSWVEIQLWLMGWAPYFEFSDTTWGVIYGILGATPVLLLIYIRERMRRRREEVRLLQDKLSNYKNSAEHWQGMYCNLLAGVMVVSKQALEGKERARSKYAAEIRESLDKVLMANPARPHLQEGVEGVGAATERWERKLRKEVKAS